MSWNELRAEYERLKQQVTRVLAGPLSPEADAVKLRQMIKRLAALTHEYDRQLGQAHTQLADAQTELADAHTQLEAAQARIAAVEAEIAELKRQLFGSKADRLTPEQEDQIKQVLQDLEAEAVRPSPDSDHVLEAGETEKRKKKRRRARRHPLPVQLETETVTIEPTLQPCPCCGQMPGRIGQEVREEIDFIPARLIRRRILRPKYACRRGGAGVTIAVLPASLIPQSFRGLGLAVHIVLARFDDHLCHPVVITAGVQLAYRLH